MGRPSAAARRGGADESIRIDMSELDALIKATKAADKKMYAQLRKALKEAAGDAVQAAQDKVLEPPPPKFGTAKRGLKVTKRKDGSLRKQIVMIGYNARQDASRTRSRGTRKAIAGSISATVPTVKSKRAEVTIKANAGRMPEGQKPMVKAYNSSKPFRRPVFPDSSRERDKWSWGYQAGNPYFGSVVLAKRDDMLRAIEAAMEKFLRQLGD